MLKPDTDTDTAIPEIRLSAYKTLLGRTKTCYNVIVTQETNHREPRLFGILRIRQTGLSGLVPKQHETMLFLLAQPQETLREICERKPVWRKFTQKGIFLNRDFISGQAFDLIREFQNTHDLTPIQ